MRGAIDTAALVWGFGIAFVLCGGLSGALWLLAHFFTLWRVVFGA